MDLEGLIRRVIRDLDLEVLQITIEHAFQVSRLPVFSDHKDPSFAGVNALYKKASTQLFTRFDTVKQSLPQRSAEIDVFAGRARDITALTDQATVFTS